MNRGTGFGRRVTEQRTALRHYAVIKEVADRGNFRPSRYAAKCVQEARQPSLPTTRTL